MSRITRPFCIRHRWLDEGFRETVGWICVRSAKADLAELEGKIHLAEALATQATLAVQMARLSEQAREGAVLAERNRIARDIHDTLAQGFTGVVLILEAANRTLLKDNIAAAREHIDTAGGLARACLAEARLSVRALHRDAAPRAGLRAGAQAYLLKDVQPEELFRCIRAVHAGEAYLQPKVAAKLVQRVQEPHLTEREVRILKLLAQGKSNRRIGEVLNITEGTFKSHLKSMFAKLDVTSRAEAVALAVKRGLIKF